MITKPKVQKIRVKKWLDGIMGGTSTLNMPDKLAGPITSEMIGQAAIGGDEDTLLANYRDRGEWCLLTSKRLIWCQGEILRIVPWREIVGAQQPPEQSAKIIRGEVSKNQITDLEIYDASGQRYVIVLEPGDAYYIIWSAILEFCNYTRKPDPIPL